MANQGNYGSEHHGSPASAFANAFAVTAGLLAIADLLDEPGRRRAERRAHEDAVAWQKRARLHHWTQYRDKLAEVASEAELTDLDRLRSIPEYSYSDIDFLQELHDTWALANPAQYPSQDQRRQSGLLCRCLPADGHTCAFGELPRQEQRHEAAVAAPLWPQVVAWTAEHPQRVVTGLLWLPFGIWCLFMALVGPVATTDGGDYVSFWWASAVLGAGALWSTWFLRHRAGELQSYFNGSGRSQASPGGPRASRQGP